jgi:hypothetical protein
LFKRLENFTAEYWLAQSWGELTLQRRQDFPKEWAAGSARRFNLDCTCGRVSNPPFYTLKEVKSCGKCSFKSREYWLNQRWGTLMLDSSQDLPDEWPPISTKKFKFICECKRTTLISFGWIHKRRSCGKCSFKSKKYWLGQTWGELKLDPDQNLRDEWGPSCSYRMKFLCSCGRTATTAFINVGAARNLSCGNCTAKPKEYWLSQTWGYLTLDSNQDLPKEWPPAYKNKLQFICGKCKKATSPSFVNVYKGLSQSCGCVRMGRTSLSSAHKIFEFVQFLCPDAEESYWFRTDDGDRREYDIYVPSKKLAIEYHGLPWHTDEKIKKKDWEKYKVSTNRGIRLLQIYSDEWKNFQGAIKSQIQEILAPLPKTSVTPSFSLETSTSSYLTVTANHGGIIAGSWVLDKDGEVAIVQKVHWDNDLEIDGSSTLPHKAAFELIRPWLKERGVSKLVALTDNRSETGELYQSLGFKFERELPPDYQFTNGFRRISKYSSQRKKGKKWLKIWDSGKREYSYQII